MLKEFRNFLLRGNLIELAVALIMGIAFGAVVKSLVDNLITPIIGMIGGVDFSSETFTINGSHFLYGQFINDVIYFVLVAAAVFFVIVKPVNMLMERSAAPRVRRPRRTDTGRAPDRDPRPARAPGGLTRRIGALRAAGRPAGPAAARGPCAGRWSTVTGVSGERGAPLGRRGAL